MDIKIAFSDMYIDALNSLTPNVQSQVNKLVLKFQDNPKSPGLNYEKLTGVKDKKLRSLRVDQTYRVILAAPEEGNLYLFLWVDHHDKAYQWAKSRVCKVNPNTGSIQLYTTEIHELENQLSTTQAHDKLFDSLKDRELMKLGIPEEYLSLVRSIEDQQSFDLIESILPKEAYEGLFLYLAGDKYEDILRQKDVTESESFSTENFKAALERLETQSHFAVPKDEADLKAMMNASIEKWRVFLHPTQRKLADGQKSGSVRVLGGAGTGKTVVAIHRAKWLAKNIASPEKKVLFTTYTKNLAIDIEKNLASICSPEEMALIEVVNLDKWVQYYLRKNKYEYDVVFNQSTLNKLWDKAISEKPLELDLSDSFYKEEWQRVIQAQGIRSLKEYKKVSRIGRGTRLDRKARVMVWKVFEEYRLQLNRGGLKEVDDAYYDASKLLENEGNLNNKYCAVVVDEAQDMGTQAFNLLRQIVTEGANDLFIVGDAHQRIYGKNRVVLSHCGIQIRGRSSKLKINYRTTDEIRKWAVNLLEGRQIDDLDGGVDTNKLYKSLTHGNPPVIERFDSITEQSHFIKALVESFEGEKSHFCVVARTNNEVKAIKDELDTLGVENVLIKPDKPEKDTNSIKLATVHRVKGLEFDSVVLASANKGLVPLDFVINNKADLASMEEADTEERSLIYVAVTRARKDAYVLAYGELSEYF